MTDSEIKTALKGAILNTKGYDSKVWSIEVYKLENALDLINRLQAENERLKEKQEKCFYCTEQANKKISEIKAEAYKEFAERVKEKKSVYNADDFYWIKYIPERAIDNLLKEMVGDK